MNFIYFSHPIYLIEEISTISLIHPNISLSQISLSQPAISLAQSSAFELHASAPCCPSPATRASCCIYTQARAHNFGAAFFNLQATKPTKKNPGPNQIGYLGLSDFSLILASSSAESKSTRLHTPSKPALIGLSPTNFWPEISNHPRPPEPGTCALQVPWSTPWCLLTWHPSAEGHLYSGARCP